MDQIDESDVVAGDVEDEVRRSATTCLHRDLPVSTQGDDTTVGHNFAGHEPVHRRRLHGSALGVDAEVTLSNRVSAREVV